MKLVFKVILIIIIGDYCTKHFRNKWSNIDNNKDFNMVTTDTEV